jgi:regulation of enolase protein 1 (concanavalin A-like superfamily)
MVAVIFASVLCLTLLSALGINIYLGQTAEAALTASVAPDASCAALATVSRSATNGPTWGRTLLAGGSAAGGWFGVDVCGNGANLAAPNPANVSCDRAAKSWTAAGCAPGNPTSDGYGLSFQCVELAIRFSAWAFGDQPTDWGRSGWGNAPDLWLPANHPSGFVAFPNGSAQAPVPGDLIVWGALDARGNPFPAGPDGFHGGHIAVVAAVRAGMVITAEQNVMWGNTDQPSDRLALTKVGGHWILSGSAQPASVLPTYRWAASMGVARATYGWLHSLRNNGTFPAVHRISHLLAAPPRPLPQQPSGGLPTLAPAAFVTANGQLADLVWSSAGLLAPATADAPTRAAPRSLGNPASGPLATGQTPAILVLPDGGRVVYALGADGHLYAARTAPNLLGVAWLDLGAPDGATLRSAVSATTFSDGVAVAALDGDGALWWRAGPDGQLGGWLSLGRPTGTTITPAFAIVGAPGSGSPLILAVGANGLLYERIWKQAIVDTGGAVAVPAGWSDWIALHNVPAGVKLAPRLAAVPELAALRAAVGPWRDAPLSVFLLGADGKLWWLRTTSLSVGWTMNPVGTQPAPVSVLLAATLAAQPGAASTARPRLHVYAASQDATYLAALDLPTRTFLGAAPKWTKLPALPAGVSGAFVALPTANDASALLAGDGRAYQALGAAGAADVLAPSASPAAADQAQGQTQGQTQGATQTTAPATPAQPHWVGLGALTLSPAFGDTFAAQSSLDARWTLAGAGARAALADGGLTLSAAAGSQAALLQGAQPGNASETVRVTLPATSTAARAGLALYLDDGDWVTLLAAPDGSVQLCAQAWQKAAPCQSRAVSAAAVQSVWLRLTRSGDTFTAEASADGATWASVGSWTPALPSVATPATGAGKASTSARQGSVAPLAFTAAGLLIENDGADTASVRFAGFAPSAVPAAAAINAPASGN